MRRLTRHSKLLTSNIGCGQFISSAAASTVVFHRLHRNGQRLQLIDNRVLFWFSIISRLSQQLLTQFVCSVAVGFDVLKTDRPVLSCFLYTLLPYRQTPHQCAKSLPVSHFQVEVCYFVKSNPEPFQRKRHAWSSSILFKIHSKAQSHKRVRLSAWVNQHCILAPFHFFLPSRIHPLSGQPKKQPSVCASDVDGPGAGPVDTTRDFNARPVTTMHLRPSSAVGALCVHSDPPFLASEARLSFASLPVLQFRHADARMKNGASQCIL